MNSPRDLFSNRLARHFGAAAAATVVVGNASAAIVQSSVANVLIPVTQDGIYINVVTGATGSAGASVSGWDINPYGNANLSFFQPTGGGYMRGDGSSTTRIDNLAIGSVVGAAGSFGAGRIEDTGSTAALLNSDFNFVGFRFRYEGTGLTHYGYMQIRLGASETDPVRAILGIWYEDVAGASITVAAGSPSVPLPGAAGLAAIGLAGLSRRRRR